MLAEDIFDQNISGVFSLTTGERVTEGIALTLPDNTFEEADIDGEAVYYKHYDRQQIIKRLDYWMRNIDGNYYVLIVRGYRRKEDTYLQIVEIHPTVNQAYAEANELDHWEEIYLTDIKTGKMTHITSLDHVIPDNALTLFT